jgi:hypothetical protein
MALPQVPKAEGQATYRMKSSEYRTVETERASYRNQSDVHGAEVEMMEPAPCQNQSDGPDVVETMEQAPLVENHARRP